MKLTTTQLRKIIKEEIQKSFKNNPEWCDHANKRFEKEKKYGYILSITCNDCGADITHLIKDEDDEQHNGTCSSCGEFLEPDYSRAGIMGGSTPDYICPNCDIDTE